MCMRLFYVRVLGFYDTQFISEGNYIGHLYVAGILSKGVKYKKIN